MELIEKDIHDAWDALIQKENPHSSGLFLQTWKWGEFQKQEGFGVIRLASLQKKSFVFQATLIRRPLPFGFSYLYCPRGPVFNSALAHEEVRERFLDFRTNLFELARDQKAVFCKIEPPMHFATERMRQLLHDSLFIPSLKQIQPTMTQILDLKKSEVELQSQCKPKTRYNIKVASRQGVFIKEEKNTAQFLSLLRDTAQRDKFHTHAPAHYERMVKLFKSRGKEDPIIKTFFAYKNEAPIGTIMALFHFPWVYYLHGAFDYNYRSLMAPFLLHWHIIERAKKQKFLFYDLWGVDEKRWPGVTRFKEGFGGARVILPGAFDLTVNPALHALYRKLLYVKELFS